MKDVKTNPVKGMLDYHPNLMLEERFIINKIRKMAQRNNFVEYDSPALELWDTFAKKSSNEILENQAYSFTDKGNRKLILKPEITPVLARLVSRYGSEYKKPLKWFTIGKCFRYENPQKGRLREFKQINFDIIEEEHYYYDYLILKQVVDLFDTFGVDKKNYYILYNHRGILEDLLAENQFSASEKDSFFFLLDHKSKLSSTEYKAYLEKSFPGESSSSREKIRFIEKYLSLNDVAEVFQQFPFLKKKYDLSKFLELTSHLSAEVKFSPEIVRGFDYYTGLVFEVFAKNQDIKRSLFGGGRYNDLIGKYTKNKTSGIGFGMGVHIFGLFLKSLNLIDSASLVNLIEYYIAPLSEELLGFALETKEKLQKENPNRADDIVVEIGFPASVKKHYKNISHLKVKNIIFLGEKELSEKRFNITKVK